jgi:hypothetical protein
VTRSKNQAEHYLKVAAKLNRSKWGDDNKPQFQFNTQNNTIVCDEETRKKIQDMREQMLGRPSIKDHAR